MASTESNNQILIADSSVFYLRNITLLLQREGYGVIIANDSKELLSLALTKSPDLIMVDARLPEPSGKSILQAIRGNSVTEAIPLILTVNEGNTQSERDSVKLLTKPIQTSALIAALLQLLYPSPMVNQEITLISDDHTVSWKTHILRQIGSQRLLLQQNEWPADLALAFRSGKKCSLEYVSTDRARIEYSASIGNDLKEGLELRLDGPTKRSQQRQFFRKAVTLNVRYRFQGDFYRLTQTLDLSGGGAKLAEVPCGLGIGEDFELVLLLPNKKYELNARIQWQRTISQDKQEVGVIFTDISCQDQEEIVMFLFGQF